MLAMAALVRTLTTVQPSYQLLNCQLRNLFTTSLSAPFGRGALTKVDWTVLCNGHDDVMMVVFSL